MEIPHPEELIVQTLGEPRFNSPFLLRERGFVNGDDRILVTASSKLNEEMLAKNGKLSTFEKAGPRRQIFFNPKDTTCGIVTCGGLCPGLNDVIRSITLSALNNYGVRKVLGFRYGYKGLSRRGQRPIELTENVVEGIQEVAGTFLGSSRGPQDPEEMVDVLLEYGVNILFALGGDGTLRGADKIAETALRRNLEIAVIGIPKTIDNDICWTSSSFGFYTAVEQAKNAVHAAHAEAKGAENGIGLVKLMGRDSGFIATHAVRASGVANFCLIPESPFDLYGDGGFLSALERRLNNRHHAVVVVSEGAGQDLVASDNAATDKDASGNVKYKDIGLFLKDKITQYLTERGMTFTLKYIDPSYIIRSAPADTIDAEYCLLLGLFAVHSGMAGHTGVCVSKWKDHFVNVPIKVMVKERKVVDTNNEMWQSVLDITGQPARMKN